MFYYLFWNIIQLKQIIFLYIRKDIPENYHSLAKYMEIALISKFEHFELSCPNTIPYDASFC